MKYLYYIAVIVIFISAVGAWAIFSKAQVKLAKPAVVINDRIITRNELTEIMKSKPHDMTKEQFLDSVILNELLIQEAVKRGIYKEEPFRKSVEKYYEQSLIKILLDRQWDKLNPEVTESEIEKYRHLTRKKVFISKIIYRNLADAKEEKVAKIRKIESAFEYLSDDLKFIVLKLDKGELSRPIETQNGVVVYRLNNTEPLKNGMKSGEADIQKIQDFFREKKKELLFEEWTDKLKAQAEIWRNM